MAVNFTGGANKRKPSLSVPQMDQDMLKLLEHLMSHPVFMQVRIAQALVFGVMFVVVFLCLCLVLLDLAFSCPVFLSYRLMIIWNIGNLHFIDKVYHTKHIKHNFP